MTSIDVDLDGPDRDPAPGPDLARRRRRALVVLAALVAVVAVGLGVRAVVDDGAVDPSALPGVDAMAASVEHLTGERGAAFAGQSWGPEAPMGGSATSPDGPRTVDLAVACTSVDGASAHLTVRSGGAVVVRSAVPCTHGGDASQGPTLTTVADVELGAAWSVEVAADSVAAVAVASS